MNTSVKTLGEEIEESEIIRIATRMIREGFNTAYIAKVSGVDEQILIKEQNKYRELKEGIALSYKIEKELAIRIADNMLKEGDTVENIVKATLLDSSIVSERQKTIVGGK